MKCQVCGEEIGDGAICADCEKIAVAERKYDFSVYGTQGGGLVKETAPGNFVFVEEPTGSGLKVGDKMPAEWSIAPANQKARQQMDEDQFGPPMKMGDMLRIIADHPDPRD